MILETPWDWYIYCSLGVRVVYAVQWQSHWSGCSL